MNTITIDIGTTTIKCALFEDGVMKKHFGKEYALCANGKCVTQNAEDWCRLIAEGVRSFGDLSEVGGVCISSQGITIVPVDKDGTPLSDAVSWLDVSAEEELEAMKKAFGEEHIFAVTGKFSLPAYSAPKIKRMVSQNIGAAKFLMPLDYIGFLLTGEYYTDFSMASGTMLFDIHKRAYDSELMAFCGASAEQFATPVEMGERVGTVTAAAAQMFGIPEGTPVIMGAQDQKISAYACKLNGETASVSIGTSTAVSVLHEPRQKVSVFAYNKKDLIYESALSTTGAAIKWLKNAAFASYDEMDRYAEETDGTDGVIFDSDFTDGAKIENITLSTNKGHLVNALYADIAKRIKAALPEQISTLILFGGGAKSMPLVRTIARVTGCKTEVPPSVETALEGADLLIRNYYN